MKLKDFKDVFGKPGTGVHQKRIFGYAFVDVIGTFFLSVIFCLIIALPWYFIIDLSETVIFEQIKFWICLFIFSVIVMFSYAILMHWLFDVKTTLTAQMFLV